MRVLLPADTRHNRYWNTSECAWNLDGQHCVGLGLTLQPLPGLSTALALLRSAGHDRHQTILPHAPPLSGMRSTTPLSHGMILVLRRTECQRIVE